MKYQLESRLFWNLFEVVCVNARISKSHNYSRDPLWIIYRFKYFDHKKEAVFAFRESYDLKLQNELQFEENFRQFHFVQEDDVD